MPTKKRRYIEPSEVFVRDFLSGLVTRIHETRIPSNATSNSTNMRLIEDGVFGKRLGSGYYGSAISLLSATRGLGVASYYSVNSSRFFVGAGINLLEYVNGQYTTVSGATFTINQNMNFVQARGDLYIHNKADQMTKFNGTNLQRLTASGTAASAGASVAAGGVIAGFGIYFKSSQVVGGNPTYTSRVFVSQASNSGNFVLQNVDGNTTDQAEWYDVAKDDGDEVMGFGVSSDSLIIFKERAIYEGRFNTAIAATGGGASGSTHFFTSILPINKGIGTVSHRTIDTMENDIVFLARGGVYLLGQQENFSGLRLAEISQPIRDVLENISTANLEKCTGIYHDKRYYLAFPFGASTVNNRILVFNREFGVWEGLWSGQNVNSFTTFIGSDGAEKLYFADDNSARVGELGVSSYADFSNAVNAEVYTKAFDLDAPELYKRWLDVTLQFKDTNADIRVDVFIDGELVKYATFTIGAPSVSAGIGSGVIGAQIIGDGGGGASSSSQTTTDRRIKINKKGRVCQIKVSNGTVNQTFNLMSVKVAYRTSYGHGAYPSANKVRATSV